MIELSTFAYLDSSSSASLSKVGLVLFRGGVNWLGSNLCVFRRRDTQPSFKKNFSGQLALKWLYFQSCLFAGFVLKSLERFGMSVERTALGFICRSCSVFIIRAWTVLRGEEDIGVSTCNSSLCCVVLPWL